MMKMPDKKTEGSCKKKTEEKASPPASDEDQQADNLICDDGGTNCLATSASVKHVVEFTIPEEPLILTEQLHANDVPRTSSAQEDPFNGLETLWA